MSALRTSRGRPRARCGRGLATLAALVLGLGCGDLSPDLVVGRVAPDSGVRFFEPVPQDAGEPESGVADASVDASTMPEARPDLTIGWVEDKPAHVVPGERFDLLVLVENLTSAPSPRPLLRATLEPTGPLAGRAAVEVGALLPMDGLGGPDARDVTLEARAPSAMTPGRYELWLEVDPDDRIAEISDTNNRFSPGAIDVGFLRITPPIVDFGTVAPSCSTSVEVVAEYLGPNRTFVTEARLDGTGVFALEPIELPVGIDRGRSLRLRLRYAPLLTGGSVGRLVFESDAFFGARELPVFGFARFNPEREDDLKQFEEPRLDLLIVVQDGCVRPGCTIVDEQLDLFQVFPAFRGVIGNALGADYRVLVTTTDPTPGRLGRLRGPPLDPTDANFDRDLRAQLLAGSNGSTRPAGLAAAEAALRAGVLREEAGALVLVLAQSDDRSGDSPEVWVDRMRAALGERGSERLRLNAIVGSPTPSCEAEPGTRYTRAVAYAGGVISDICNNDDYVALLQWRTNELGLRWRFPLEREPAFSGSIEVWVGGRRRPSVDQVSGDVRWAYDAETNSVIFQPGYLPERGQSALIRYRSRC